jgi:hypothetical protein
MMVQLQRRTQAMKKIGDWMLALFLWLIAIIMLILCFV